MVLNCLITLLLTDTTAKVVQIRDGDTIVILLDELQVEVRLEGIDCPEKGQAFATKAKEFTTQKCLGKQVRLVSKGKDKYGRTLAEVFTPAGVSVNQSLLEEGLAWHYARFNHDPALKFIEGRARREKRGLWSEADPTPPWDWRDAVKKKLDAIGQDVRITRLLPNPDGPDEGHEQFELENVSEKPIELGRWRLRDLTRESFAPVGSIEPRQRIVFTIPPKRLPLSNNGDTIELVSPTGAVVQTVKFGKVRSGEWVVVDE